MGSSFGLRLSIPWKHGQRCVIALASAAIVLLGLIGTATRFTFAYQDATAELARLDAQLAEAVRS